MPPDERLESLRLMLHGAVDYAGLFPPAALPMDVAVRNYARYVAGRHAWMVGRFIVPASRLNEFGLVARELLPRGSAPWLLSVLADDDTGRSAERALSFNCTHWRDSDQGHALIDVYELKVDAPDQLINEAGRVPGSLRPFFEVPLQSDVRAFASAASAAAVGLKARTGGITHEAFPSAASLTRFLRAAVEQGVPFKLTAGLHHPIRGEYRLTYEPGAACGDMFGFLSVFLAVALLLSGTGDDIVLQLLEERDPQSISFDAGGVYWRERAVTIEHIRSARRLLTAFGSCSFEEPVDELTSLGLLRP